MPCRVYVGHFQEITVSHHEATQMEMERDVSDQKFLYHGWGRVIRGPFGSRRVKSDKSASPNFGSGMGKGSSILLIYFGSGNNFYTKKAIFDETLPILN